MNFPPAYCQGLRLPFCKHSVHNTGTHQHVGNLTGAKCSGLGCMELEENEQWADGWIFETRHHHHL
jgi:hypothetical protein